MKKIYMKSIVILLVGLICSTKAQWILQNSPSQNNNFRDVFALDQNTAFVLGYNYTSDETILLRTTNGGENWINISVDSTEYHYYNSIYFINDSIGWIAGGCPDLWSDADFGLIEKTTDAGESWVIDTIGRGALNSVVFVDENTGWAAGIDAQYGPHGLIYKTTDGGVSWNFIYVGGGWYGSGPLWSVCFVDTNIGWIISLGYNYGQTRLLKTTDGGINWVAQLDTGFYYLKSVFFTNESVGWAIGAKWNGLPDQGVIFGTTNGGENWVIQLYGVTNNLNHIYFVDENSGWVISSGGGILNTTNGGINWITQLSDTNYHLTSVHFVDENTGWAVGENGTILKTINGGGVVPVELSTFTAIAQNDYVELIWTTATEVNNQGFEVQRSTSNSEFVTIGFVEGNGTTTEVKHYSFRDKDASGFLRYRLKQVDFDGSYEYSDIVEVEVLGNLSYELAQNYPNPFNPITNISYTLPAESQVKLSIYNPLGELVETIVNEKQEAGKYYAVWNAGNHPSGVYIYTLDAVSLNGSKQSKIAKKMILLR